MAGLEVVVRPVVFPNIRPAPAQKLPTADDPNKGICEIKGAGSFIMNFSSNMSISGSFGKQTEIKRKVDVARVSQKDADGTVNKDNFVDIEVAKKIWMKGASAPSANSSARKEGTSERDSYGQQKWVQNYLPIKETDNIEIIKRDQMRENKETSE